MKRIIISLVLALVIILSPFLFVFSFAVLSPAQFDNSFVGVLDEKVERLDSIREDKIVVVGGSSVAFGLDSALLEEYTGMPTVNFGLYAALGTKLMLDLSLDGISEGDIVVLAPELDVETLSLFFSSENTLRAIDGSFSLLSRLRGENIFGVLSGMWDFSAEKLGYMKNPEKKPNPDGVYNAKSFNSYLDISYPREENIMYLYADRVNTVKLKTEYYGEAFLEFCDYLNEYIESAENKGARVYFSFCPVNEMGIEEGTTEEHKAAFVKMLKDNIDCEFISEINNYILDAGYFYDTNFHLNDTGVKVRTMRLARDIKFAADITEGVVPKEEPKAPALPNIDITFLGEDENAKYFTYAPDAFDAYTVTGLTEEGKKQTVLTLPLGADGIKVKSISEGAFSGALATTVIIPENSNIEMLHNRLLSGAENLTRLEIYIRDCEAIIPPDKNSFGNERTEFRIYTPEGSYYSVGYEWGKHSPLIVESLK